MSELKKLDTIAYIRFASVYREFKDAAEFRDELEQLVQTRAQAAKDADSKNAVSENKDQAEKAPAPTL